MWHVDDDISNYRQWFSIIIVPAIIIICSYYSLGCCTVYCNYFHLTEIDCFDVCIRSLQFTNSLCRCNYNVMVRKSYTKNTAHQ